MYHFQLFFVADVIDLTKENEDLDLAIALSLREAQVYILHIIAVVLFVCHYFNFVACDSPLLATVGLLLTPLYPSRNSSYQLHIIH